jgi:hypothetical protein
VKGVRERERTGLNGIHASGCYGVRETEQIASEAPSEVQQCAHYLHSAVLSKASYVYKVSCAIIKVIIAILFVFSVTDLSFYAYTTYLGVPNYLTDSNVILFGGGVSKFIY